MICLQQEDARVLLPALRRAGLSPPLIGGDALGEEGFAELFASEPEEQDQPGFFTEGMYAAAPMIYDAIGGDALAFARLYQERTAPWPSWRAAKMYDAATMAIHALSVAALDGDPSAVAATARRCAMPGRAQWERRGAARAEWPCSSMRPAPSRRRFPLAVSLGASLTSAPWQYRLDTDPSQDDAAADLESGRAVAFGGWLLRRYPIVDVGIDINEIRDLDVTNESFLADFSSGFWRRRMTQP